MNTVYAAIYHPSSHLIGRGYVPETFGTREEVADMISQSKNCSTCEIYEDENGKLFWDDTDPHSLISEITNGNCTELSETQRLDS